MPGDLLRVGRIAFAPPEAMTGGLGEARAYGAALHEGEWPPLPDGPPDARRAAREADREAAWDRWWVEARASSVQEEPDGFDPAALSDRDRARLAVLRERRQLSAPDPGAPVLAPEPGDRWARAATFFATPYHTTRRVRGRVLLDAGPSLLWAEGGRRAPEDEALIEGLGVVAGAYRAGPPPDTAFALRLGALVGPPLRTRRPSGMETVGRMGKEMVRVRYASEYLGRAAGRTYAGPFAELKVKTQEEESDPPTQADLTFEQGLAIANAQLAGDGRFSAVRTGPREAGGQTGIEDVSLYRKQGERPRLTLSYDWLSRGAKADPLRPRITLEARAELDPSLSDAEALTAEAELRAVWESLLGSLVGPGQLAGRGPGRGPGRDR